MKCEFCDKEFTPHKGSGRPPKYCSVECRKKANNERRIKYVENRSITKCEFCGKEVILRKGSGRSRKYCSVECRREADKKNKRIKYIGKRQKYCIQCGIELPKFKTKYCSRRCSLIYEGKIEDHGELTKTCPICGKEFKTFKSRVITCSPRCSSIRAWRRREYSEIRVDYDISLRKLAARDNNICKNCGKKVNWKDFKSTGKTIICGDKYPSIDHIIPISKGGTHSWDNVQLAHRYCNTVKRDKLNR